jgi:hypothetical protein
MLTSTAVDLLPTQFDMMEDTVFIFLIFQVMNENEQAEEDTAEMSVGELQRLTNDNIIGSFQVRHKCVRVLMLAETRMYNLLY